MTREEAKREMLFAKREVMAGSYIDNAYDMAIKALEQPEIIYCKDCKWSEKYVPKDKTYYSCKELELYGRTDEDFCSRAERREEGDK